MVFCILYQITFLLFLAFSLWFWGFYNKKALHGVYSKNKILVLDDILGGIFYLLGFCSLIFAIFSLRRHSEYSSASEAVMPIIVFTYIHGSLVRYSNKRGVYKRASAGVESIDMDHSKFGKFRLLGTYDSYVFGLALLIATMPMYFLPCVFHFDIDFFSFSAGSDFSISVICALYMVIFSFIMVLKKGEAFVQTKQGMILSLVNLIISYVEIWAVSLFIMNTATKEFYGGMIMLFVLTVASYIATTIFDTFYFKYPQAVSDERNVSAFISILTRFDIGSLVYGTSFLFGSIGYGIALLATGQA